MLLPFLFYFRPINSPHVAILREGYSFPNSESKSTPESIFKSVIFISFFSTFDTFTFTSFSPTFKVFIYPV